MYLTGARIGELCFPDIRVGLPLSSCAEDTRAGDEGPVDHTTDRKHSLCTRRMRLQSSKDHTHETAMLNFVEGILFIVFSRRKFKRVEAKLP